MKYFATFSAAGKVVSVEDSKHLGKTRNILVRRILLDAAHDSDSFSRTIEVSLINEDCPIGDSLKPGDFITVEGTLDGRLTRVPNGKCKFFHTLEVTRLTKGANHA